MLRGMKSLLYHAFGVKGFRYLRTRYEGGEIIFELEPKKEPEVLRRHGYRWRTVRSVSIGLKPVVLKVKVPRWLNTTTERNLSRNPLCRSLHENYACARAIDRGSRPLHDAGRYCRLALPELGHGKNRGAPNP
jgi:hypothetical protein